MNNILCCDQQKYLKSLQLKSSTKKPYFMQNIPSATENVIFRKAISWSKWVALMDLQPKSYLFKEFYSDNSRAKTYVKYTSKLNRPNRLPVPNFKLLNHLFEFWLACPHSFYEQNFQQILDYFFPLKSIWRPVLLGKSDIVIFLDRFNQL